MLSADQFYEQGGKGKLLGLKCESGDVTVPPRASCRICGSTNLETVELSGKGVIISYTDVFSKAGDFPLDTPYTLAVIRLEEGGNLLATLYNSKSGKREIKQGGKVKIRFLPVFQRPYRSISENGRPTIFADLERP